MRKKSFKMNNCGNVFVSGDTKMKAIIKSLVLVCALLCNPVFADQRQTSQADQQQRYQQQQEQIQQMQQRQAYQQQQRDIQRRQFQSQQQIRNAVCPPNDYRCRL